MGSTRNELTDLGFDLELVYKDNEALLSRGEGEVPPTRVIFAKRDLHVTMYAWYIIKTKLP